MLLLLLQWRQQLRLWLWLQQRLRLQRRLLLSQKREKLPAVCSKKYPSGRRALPPARPLFLK